MFFRIWFSKKNAEVIKFLGILKKYVSENKYIFAQERKAIFFRLIKKLFSDNVEWSSKNLWKMISADVKANKNNKK